MSHVNAIGLNSAKSDDIVKSLNTLLSSYQIQYMNARGFHWNIKGRNFFELHVKFEEIYNLLLLKVDEIAERILTLDGAPLHAFSDYLEVSEIKEAKGISDGVTAVENILAGYSTLIKKQREILNQAGDAGDEGTASLMGDYISEQEKLVWMLKAYLD
ncbi:MULTISPECIES: Dps family protein [Pseudoalteromonas]|jgi:starvation-inducible DNA-binding protein|uniref:Dps family protein n=1 Tax=Pseudoalteromonas TaxID=53246 RepID=UPI0000EAA4DF|nr:MULTISPECIES: Dps family protein [unclassified Pseudoalteromonas]EAW26851.1 DNA-binding DPS protein [Alteromonadales bacterium TW-7]MBL1386714.1 DNA starvation/stationary phase protection protein [Colwellia sp.]MCK8123138.1 DNA starvation/stationary phase protection protein [Pseudoalteromonas sp. 2CM32C]TMS82194.1 DNA starvation/stationary phase protection protein [Pseudoalteromonas sp. S554]BBW89976.1 DNA starvation/stationary phase protection protein [Pseudoalteromonas sp. PS1M3]|tara:strand:+ start:2506 stop:2979 length:474 start_codon:yes stop_codon:yes gene_type:complete